MDFHDNAVADAFSIVADGGIPESRKLEKLDITAISQGMRVDVEWFRMLAQSTLANESGHSHSSIEIHFLMEGSHIFFLDAGAVHVGSGQGIIMPPNCRHRLYNSGGRFVRYVLNCTITAIDENPEALFLQEALCSGNVWRFDITRVMADLLNECAREAADALNGYVSMIEINVLKVLLLLARVRTGWRKAEYSVVRKSTFSRRTAEGIKDFIDQNVRRRLTVNNVAEHMHMSTKQLQRVFKQEYGVTVYQMISQMRLQEAKKMLRETSLTIGEISACLEFSTEQSFCRFFKHVEGQSPDAYRKGALAQK